ncbi:MAG: GNAT family N-acetyltransferase [Candidatus Marinimicrobia bacterium]|nr:GNAT family N-acetyltransferase [Candidatus Neomarinimicrobiota bacterium]
MFELKSYNPKEESQWDDFVEKSNNGTIFHLRRFLNYHPKGRFKDQSILIEKKGKLFSVLPAVEHDLQGSRYLISHPGSTVGSFVVAENLSIADAMEIVSLLIEFAKKNNFDGVRITLPPVLYQRRLSHYLDFAFFKSGFKYLKRDLTSILFLENSLQQNLDKFRSSHKRAVRNAESKGVLVKKTNDFATFYKILDKNLSIRHGVTPTHNLNELLDLHQRFPERINLFGAFINNQMVAGVVNFIVNKQVVLAFYISHDESFKDYRAVNLLFFSIFDWAIQQKFKIYDFGIFTVNGEPNMGLGRFKENFGSSGIFRDTIEIKL